MYTWHQENTITILCDTWYSSGRFSINCNRENNGINPPANATRLVYCYCKSETSKLRASIVFGLEVHQRISTFGEHKNWSPKAADGGENMTAKRRMTAEF